VVFEVRKSLSCYHPGEQVKGIVVVKTTTPLSARTLEMHLQGEYYFRPEYSSDFVEKPFFNSGMVAWEGSTSAFVQTLNVGDNEFNFSFDPLPENTPPTVSGDQISVHYMIKCILRMNFGDDHTKELEIDVHHDHAKLLNVANSLPRTVSSDGSKLPNVSLKLSIPEASLLFEFCRDDPVDVEFEIANHSFGFLTWSLYTLQVDSVKYSETEAVREYFKSNEIIPKCERISPRRTLRMKRTCLSVKKFMFDKSIKSKMLIRRFFLVLEVRNFFGTSSSVELEFIFGSNPRH